jgi:hypothetical protein
MRVHRTLMITREKVAPGAFRNQPAGGNGMSTNWNKYSTPEATQIPERVGGRAEDNAVISMRVDLIQRIPGQSVEHTPTSVNRAHTDVWGDKKTDPQVRVEFTKIAFVEIGLEREPAEFLK